MAPCKFAYTLSEFTVRRAPQNLRCRTIQTVMTVRLSVAEVCRSTVHRFFVTTGRVLPKKLYRRHGALPDFHAFGMGNNVRGLQKLPRFPLLV